MSIFKKLFSKPVPLLITQKEKTYWEEATDWRYERYESQTVWLNRSLIALFVLSGLLGISILANVFLSPLKERVPYVYTVNETTGEITELKEGLPNKVSNDWLMTRFLLIRYVINRENYSVENLDYPYQITWAMSDTPIANTYSLAVSSSNPQSPYNVYGKSKFITVHVLSVEQLNEDTAEMRFNSSLQDASSGQTQTIEKTAIIKWAYHSQAETQTMLDRDPLGFKVTYYQSSQVNLDNS